MALIAVITEDGEGILSQATATGLEFTGAKLGREGMRETSETDAHFLARIREFTDVEDSSPVTALISKVTPTDNSVKVTVQYNNSSQTGVLEVNEIGIFGRLAGTSDTPKMICYADFDGVTDDIQPAEAALFARLYEIIIAITGIATVTVNVPSGAYQEAIGVQGLLYGDGNGNIYAVDNEHYSSFYALAQHTHAASDIVSGTLPIARGGTNASTAAQALANRGVIYSATEPTYQEGAIWLQPVS